MLARILSFFWPEEDTSKVRARKRSASSFADQPVQKVPRVDWDKFDQMTERGNTIWSGGTRSTTGYQRDPVVFQNPMSHHGSKAALNHTPVIRSVGAAGYQPVGSGYQPVGFGYQPVGSGYQPVVSRPPVGRIRVDAHRFRRETEERLRFQELLNQFKAYEAPRIPSVGGLARYQQQLAVAGDLPGGAGHTKVVAGRGYLTAIRRTPNKRRDEPRPVDASRRAARFSLPAAASTPGAASGAFSLSRAGTQPLAKPTESSAFRPSSGDHDDPHTTPEAKLARSMLDSSISDRFRQMSFTSSFVQDQPPRPRDDTMRTSMVAGHLSTPAAAAATATVPPVEFKKPQPVPQPRVSLRQQRPNEEPPAGVSAFSVPERARPDSGISGLPDSSSEESTSVSTSAPPPPTATATDDEVVIVKEVIYSPPVQNALLERMRSEFLMRVQVDDRRRDLLQAERAASSESRDRVRRVCDAKLRRSLVESRLVPELELPEPAAPVLSAEQQARVAAALTLRDLGHVLARSGDMEIRRKDLATLEQQNWLNDEIINGYLTLITQRAPDRVYSMSTFFYEKLSTSGYAGVRRWTRRVDLFSKELLIIPIHLAVHWTLAVVRVKKRLIEYYDSMGASNNHVLSAILSYLESEHKDKKKSPLPDGWVTKNIKDIPQQRNGSDCGVFAISFAERLSRNAAITFTQDDMQTIRRVIMFELINTGLVSGKRQPCFL